MKRSTATRNTAETKLTLFNHSKATGLWQIVVSYSYKGQLKRFATGYRVPENHWNTTKQEIKAGGVDEVGIANAHLRTVKANLDGIIRSHIQAHGEKPSISTLEAEYNKLKTPEPEKVPEQTEIISALESFISTKRVRPNSLKAYTALAQNIRLYQPAKAWTLENLSLTDFNMFQTWLVETKGFHNTTVERRVIAMKKFLESHEGKLRFHYKDLKPAYKVRPPKNLQVITLNVTELKALEALDLSSTPRMHRVHILFLLQCWTGLRFADVVRLTNAHVDGDTVRIDINKTGDYSAIPLFPTSTRILKEIGSEPLSISNQEYNRVLKDVMKYLSQTVPSLLKPITQFHAVGVEKTKTTKPKWAWVSSHTARRGFITMCIQKGIAQHFVMKWSNHSDPRSFRKYQNAMQGESDAVKQLVAAFNE